MPLLAVWLCLATEQFAVDKRVGCGFTTTGMALGQMGLVMIFAEAATPLPIARIRAMLEMEE
jgi:hypothetical protein